jgi:BirA family transcriptional regulator, biotin operon repressor / biotin---[acetyl-CoA-carboxylase] ligase
MRFKKIYLPVTTSTNDYALQNIRGLEDKTIIFADVQTKGKGRNARTWVSEKNNLFTSFVLKPKYDFHKKNTLHALTQYSAVVLTRVFQDKYLIEAKIKWPNDLFVGDKKIAGILTESVIQGDVLQGVVVGIGVNLNCGQDVLEKIDKPATSLHILAGREIERDAFLDFLLQEFFIQYDALLEKGFLLIREEYILKNMFLGKQVKAVVFDQTYCGIAEEIDEEGRLVLDCKGKKKIISIGDIIC